MSATAGTVQGYDPLRDKTYQSSRLGADVPEYLAWKRLSRGSPLADLLAGLADEVRLRVADFVVEPRKIFDVAVVHGECREGGSAAVWGEQDRHAEGVLGYRDGCMSDFRWVHRGEASK